MATRSTDTERGELPTAVVEDLLSDEHRRTALTVLAERDEPMVVSDLAAATVAARDDCVESAVDTGQREAMREELFREHIPKLTATNVLEYDSMLGTVELVVPEVLEAR